MHSLAKQLTNLAILEIGDTTVVLLLAELGDLRRFGSTNKINAFGWH